MTKYWLSNLHKMGMILLITVTMFGSVVSCTKTDDTTGNDNFIPDGGDYKMFIGHIDGGFITKTKFCDSIASDGFSTAYLGSQVTTKEGQINYSFVNQVLHYEVPYMDDENNPFGKDFQLDSAFLSLNFSNYIGEYGEKVSIYVYELKKELPHKVDSTYYSNFNINEYIGQEPTFIMDAKLDGKSASLKIPNEYAKKFMSLKGSEYKNDDTFRSYFPGYYFKMDKVSTGNQILAVNPNTSGFSMYYHNKNEKPDTIIFDIDFTKTYTDNYNQVHYVNTSFNLIDRDYSLRDANFGVKLDSKTVTYASGMAGLITTLEIPENIIEQIKDMVRAKGGSKIIVSNATMTLPVADTDITSLDQSLRYIGLYRDYQPIKSRFASYDNTNTLQDYSLYYMTTDIFDGILNRSTNKFKINVSSLIQGLVNETSDVRVVEIGPGFKTTESSGAESFGVASFENSEKRPITMELTYSVVK